MDIDVSRSIYKLGKTASKHLDESIVIHDSLKWTASIEPFELDLDLGKIDQFWN